MNWPGLSAGRTVGAVAARVAAGLPAVGRGAAGFVEIGLVEAGRVAAGFVEAGVVEAGVVEVGFVVAGFVEAGAAGDVRVAAGFGATAPEVAGFAAGAVCDTDGRVAAGGAVARDGDGGGARARAEARASERGTMFRPDRGL